jgi:hypothetical protein
MKLRETAHSRTGDKGDISNISVIAFDEADYAFLEAHLTAARVAEHFQEILTDKVTRYELPNLGGLNFGLSGMLAGGVTRSLGVDAHGKTLSSALLDLELGSP